MLLKAIRVCTFGALLLLTAPVAHGERLALVIGNSDYAVARLSSPRLDAEAMHEALARLGFSVTRATDVGRAEMYRQVREFAERVKAATRKDRSTMALFYYSGHGMELEGRNYLVPVDADIHGEQDVPVQAVELNLVIRYLIGAGANPSVVVLDACRDNPYEKGWKSVGEGGLAAVNDVPPGMLVAFAAAPGHRAPQGVGRLSPYTEVLVQELGVATGTVVDTFRQVANGVYQRSLAGKVPQVPHIDLVPGLSDEFRFVRQTESAPASAATAIPEARPPPASIPAPSAGERPASMASSVPPPASATASAAAALPSARAADPAVPGTKLGRGRIFRDCPDCPDMVVIPDGSFLMGSPPDEEGRDANELPQHRVHVPAFALATRVITLAEWRTCVDSTICRPAEQYPRKPADGPAVLDWKQVHQFIEWLSKKSGQTYFLPSEAQWEYAARAGTRTARWWGEDIGVGHAACTDCGPPWENTKQAIAPVGTFGPNPFGLYDMLGNVFQWVADCWHDNYQGAPPDGSAWLAEGKCPEHVTRGGSSFVDARHVRSAARWRGSYFETGARVARAWP